MSNSRTTPRLLALAAALACGCAFASPHAIPEVSRGTVEGHAYQSGGAGLAQRAEMKQHAGDYDLHLAFSEGPLRTAARDVKLSIFDASGKRAFALNDAGPRTDVQLPPGHWRIKAQADGATRVANVDLKPGRPARLSMHWTHHVAA